MFRLRDYDSLCVPVASDSLVILLKLSFRLSR